MALDYDTYLDRLTDAHYAAQERPIRRVRRLSLQRVGQRGRFIVRYSARYRGWYVFDRVQEVKVSRGWRTLDGARRLAARWNVERDQREQAPPAAPTLRTGDSAFDPLPF